MPSLPKHHLILPGRPILRVMCLGTELAPSPAIVWPVLMFQLMPFSYLLYSSCSHQGDLSELGKVLMQGSFSVWTGHRKGPTKMKDLARFKPMQRHLFLYEKALVFCKKREEHGDGYDKTSSYSFKHFLKVRAFYLEPLPCLL